MWTFLFFSMLLTVLHVEANSRFRDGKCEEKLLDDRHRVPDSAFNQSSAYQEQYMGYAARESYDRDNEQFAWCPVNQVHKELREFITIDLGSLRLITHIWTKGRTARGTGSESTPFYYMRYKREASESTWRQYRHADPAIGERLRGNLDPTVESIAELSPKIIARFLMIVPYSEERERRVCMKIQIYGCDFEEPFVEYRVPYGQDLDSSMNGALESLERSVDAAYDGRTESNPYLGVMNEYSTYAYGLGILSDGFVPLSVLPADGVAQDSQALNRPGVAPVAAAKVDGAFGSRRSAYMSWIRGGASSLGPATYVDLVFRFLGIYNVTRFHLYLANGDSALPYSRLPLAVEIWMGLDVISRAACWRRSDSAPAPPVADAYHSVQEDERNVSPRWLDFEVAKGFGAAGNFSRIRMHFRSNYAASLALSEVSFTASPTSLHLVSPKGRGITDEWIKSPSKSSISPTMSNNKVQQSPSPSAVGATSMTTGPTNVTNSSVFDTQLVLIVAGVTLILVACVLVLATFACLHRFRRRHHSRKQKLQHLTHFGGGPSGGMGGPTSMVNGGYLSQHGHYAHQNPAMPYSPQLQQPLLSTAPINYYPSLPASSTPFPPPELTPLDISHQHQLTFLSHQMANSTKALCFAYNDGAPHPYFSSANATPLPLESMSHLHQNKARPATMIGAPGVVVPPSVDNNSLYNSLRTCHTSGGGGGGGGTMGDANGSDTESGCYHYAQGSPHYTEASLLGRSSHPANGGLQHHKSAMLGSQPGGAGLLSHSSGTSLSLSHHYEPQLAPLSASPFIPSGVLCNNPLASSDLLTNNNNDTPPQGMRNLGLSSPATPLLCNPMGTLPLPPVTDRLPTIDFQGVCGTSIFSTPATTSSSAPLSNDGMNPNPENLGCSTTVPWDQLEISRMLGGGEFAQVHVGIWRSAHQSVQESEDPSNCPNSHRTVLVRLLKSMAPKKVVSEFTREIHTLSRLRHSNFSQILGVCCGETSGVECAVLLEWPVFGDLHSLLQRHNLAVNPSVSEEMLSSPSPTISPGTLIYLATQISSGMKYLEQLDMAHRDLACRNCRIGERFSVKISDMGLRLCEFREHYYHPSSGGSPLPIRWMATESVLQSVFTPKTDVWSFGVTLWELLTLCRELPFNHLSDERVLANVRLLSGSDPRAEALVPPQGCARELSDLMQQCWARSPQSRPSFHEVHMFLQRKNLGFVPPEVQLQPIGDQEA